MACELGGGGSGSPKRTSFVPTTSKTSTDWCAVTARPLSVTIVGTVTLALVHASRMPKTMSFAYSWML